MVLILLLLLCNHDNLILKLHQKKIAKKCQPNSYINLHNRLKNCLSRKIWKNYYSMYIEEREWVNAQILLTNC